MKSKAFFLLLLILFTVSVVAVVITDRKLSYYGKSDFYPDNLLPFDIHILYGDDFEGGMVMLDKFGVYILAKGQHVKLNSHSNFIVAKITGYIYNQQYITVNIRDSQNTHHTINFRETPSGEIVFNVDDKITDINKYQRIVFFDSFFQNLYIIRNYSELVTVITSCIMLFLLFRQLKKARVGPPLT